MVQVADSQHRVLAAWQTRVAEEIKLYVSNKPEDKARSLREKYLRALILGLEATNNEGL